MLKLARSLVGATGIEPVTPTVSRLAPNGVSDCSGEVNQAGGGGVSGFCRGEW